MASAELALGTKIDLGHSQHCRRVALWADEIAASLNVNSQERCSLRQAALGHHDPAPNIAPKPVLISQGRSRTPGVCTSEEILDCFHEPREKAPGRAADLAHVLELANTFDEQLEYLPFAEADLDSLLENADSDTGQDDWTVRYVLSRLQKIDRSDL
ncbi:MAG TPA: hypothetical protein VEQ63_16455, partial [Bryobacteraceae bacterium]|nr:hypothetical protein [Bryobacteraceae bacterium]